MSQLFDRQPPFPSRPWNGRGYGRIRVNEGDANDLFYILREETERRIQEYGAAKESGDELRIAAAKHALKRVNRMRKFTWNVLVEQGWATPD